MEKVKYSEDPNTYLKRKVHQFKDITVPTFPYLSCVYITSIFAFLEELFLLLLCVIDIRIKVLKLIKMCLFCGAILIFCFVFRFLKQALRNTGRGICGYGINVYFL